MLRRASRIMPEVHSPPSGVRLKSMLSIFWTYQVIPSKRI